MARRAKTTRKRWMRRPGPGPPVNRRSLSLPQQSKSTRASASRSWRAFSPRPNAADPTSRPPAAMPVELRLGGRRHRLQVREIGPGEYRVAASGWGAHPRLGRANRWGGMAAHLRRREVARALCLGWPAAIPRGERRSVHRDARARWRGPLADPRRGGGPGRWRRDSSVAAGDLIARLESMKLEAQVTAPFAGIVREVLVTANAHVEHGTPLVRIDAAADAAVSTDVEPLALWRESSPAATSLREQWSAALADLRSLLLGFDVTPSEARQLVGDLARAVRRRTPRGCADRRGDGRLSRGLRRHPIALQPDSCGRGARASSASGRDVAVPARRGVSRRKSGPRASCRSYAGLSLTTAPLRTSLATSSVWPCCASGRLSNGPRSRPRRWAASSSASSPPGHSPSPAPARLSCSRGCADLGRGRYPGLTDLARELRYRRFDEPVFARARSAAYAQAEADIDRFDQHDGPRAARRWCNGSSTAHTRWPPG